MAGESDLFDHEFDILVEGLLEAYHVPGMSIAIVDRGQVKSKGYGLARLPNVQATADTLYFTGSTTKAMVAACMGIAIHDRSKTKYNTASDSSLSWETPIRAVLPDTFALDDQCASNSVTIEDALSHRSGLSGQDHLYGPFIGDSPSAITRRLKFLGPLTAPFRTTFQYNNLMYAVVGDVLEHITGMKCGDVVKQWLWKPLGMNQSFWHLKEIFSARVDVKAQMSRGYFWIPGTHSKASELRREGYFIPDRFLDFASIAPAGATLSSVNDYAKWMIALINAASSSSTKDHSVVEKPTRGFWPFKRSQADSPVTPELLKDVSTPRTLVREPGNLPNSQMVPSTYGLGWAFPNSTLGALHPIMSHSGGLTGYGTELFILPNDGFGVVAMGNTSITSNIVGLLACTELIARKMGLKQKEQQEAYGLFKTSFTKDIAAFIDNQKDEAGLELLSQAQNKEKPEDGDIMKVTDFLNTNSASDQSKFEALASYQGTYRNPAYGDFKVTIASEGSSLDSKSETIQYRGDIKKDDRAERDKIRDQTRSLQVYPIGSRTWKFRYLLHPRKHYAGSGTEADFDQEMQTGHGYTDEDIVPGVPTGAENGSSSCRKENAWESTIWARLGTAFVKDDKASPRLGMTLAYESMAKTGTRNPGWEQKMMWFEKVSDADESAVNRQ